ncbi:MAG: deoxyribonuclease IV [Patescibacteria group bacterium]|jgi:deoxyribonuclease-4
MLFGAHVSIAGGIFNAPLNAAQIGAEVFQIFSRSPHGGKPSPLTPSVLSLFKQNLALTGIPEFYIHTPYFINFSSNTKRIQYGSISVVRGELERATLLGAKYVMTHLGSYKDLGKTTGLKQTIEGFEKVLKGYQGTAELLIENSAGAGDVAGDTFEEIAEIIFDKKLAKYKIGVCYDTQHAFASGYDERTGEAVKNTFNKFDKEIGLNKIKLFHCNDSLVEFGHKTDRHEHIGKGKIGAAGFEEIFKFFKKNKVNYILETKPDFIGEDLSLVKSLRAKLL